MPKYGVPMEALVTSWVTVEAENPEAAIEEAYLEGVPGLMHLNHTYPDVGEYEVPDWWLEEQIAKEQA